MARKQRVVAKWSVPIACCALLGCVSSKMYREISVQEGPDYGLAFIEFDDLGEMWAPEQLARALSLIESANRDEDGIILVTYIHGWMHNASQKNEASEKGNVHGFKRFLEMISSQQRAGAVDRRVIGVYIGWRGESSSIPGLNLLTFYSRAGAARRISGTSSSEVIYRLATTAKRNPRSRVLLMGHSFGGQLLENAVTQSLVGGLLTVDEESAAGMPADLTILVNPAAKSIQAKQFVDLLERSRLQVFRRDQSGRRYQVPLIVSVTSSADLATRWAFPMGTTISSLGKNFHRYPEESCLPFTRQRSFYIRTPGHNKALVSHEVRARPLPEEKRSALRSSSLELLGWEIDSETGERVVAFDGERSRFSIHPLPTALNATPYWIMRVPRALIPGHSGFFTQDTLRLIAAVLRISGALEPEVETEIVRELGVRPIRLVSAPDGDIFSVDASRRIYRIDSRTGAPTSVGCVPAIVDMGTGGMIGVSMSGARGLGFKSRPTTRTSIQGDGKYRTEFARFRLDEDSGLVVEKVVEVESELQFTAAAYDFERSRILLATGDSGEIYLADLIKKNEKGEDKEVKPNPRQVMDLGGAGPINELLYSGELDVVFATVSTAGSLLAISERDQAIAVDSVAEDLGNPVSLAMDEAAGLLYLGDAGEGRIWRLPCTQAAGCGPPQLFFDGDALSNPAVMTVSGQGDLWVGDQDEKIILVLSREGAVLHRIDRLPEE